MFFPSLMKNAIIMRNGILGNEMLYNDCKEVIFIKTLDGSSATIPFDPNFSIADVKQHFQDKRGVFPDRQRLIFAGKR